LVRNNVLLITVKVNDNYTTNFTYYWNNHSVLPTNKQILHEFATHYHKSFKEDLPDGAEVISVEEL
jgi:hypothetical protein